ncbi:hypothetical protein OF83DRAFT_1123784 [Amylostereum chailletii]|nr:hypothetical protein OF83DRAFT_1123784 [Amylostereum chailletii]
MRRRCIDGHYSYLKAVRDNGGIVLEHVNDDAEVDEDVAWVTAVDEGLNTHSRGYATTYGNAPSCEYSYGDMCLVVRVGKPEDRTTPPEPKALKAAARKRRRRESRRELRRTWYKERLRVGGTSYTEPPLMSDDEPLTDSEGTSYDEPEMPEESIDLPPSPSPVYALPPELLCRIFAELCREEPLGGCDNDKDIIVGELSWYISEDEDCENDDDDETSDTSDHSSSSSLCEQRGTLGWAKVTHVCRRWRYAALIDATLWRAFIPGVNAQWTAEILRRSQATALDLRVPSTERLVCISGDVMARVRSLAIKYTGPSKDEAYNFLAHPAPLLEQFEIAIPGRRFADALPLRFPLFDGHAPKLVRFSATEAFGIPWASSLFDSLTNLAIEYNPSLWRYRQHPTLSNILALLHRARAITMLTLVGCFPTKVREDEAWSERVDLPELKYIRLGGVSVGVVTSFLSFVNVPSTATVHVKMFQDAANSGDEWNQEVVSLFNLVSCDHSASVGTMFMSFNLHWLCISSSYDAVPPESLAHPLSHSLDRSLVIEGKTWKVERSLAEHLLAAAPPTAVRALSFATSDNNSDSDALFPLSTPQAFVHAASVEHLRLAGKCGADKLASFIRALEPDTGGAVYFPSLSSLALPNIGLRSAPSEGESDPSVEVALRSMLALRDAAGHRIGTLYVDKGTFKRQRTSREPWMDDLDVKVVPRGYASGEHRKRR